MGEIADQFKANGFVIVPDVFKPFHMNAVTEVLHEILARGENSPSLERQILNREAEDHAEVYNASISCGSSAAAYRMIGDGKLMESVCAATGVMPWDLHFMPMHFLIQNPGKTQFDYKWHQEGAFYPWCPGIINIWFPIRRPSREESGTLCLIPGSHKRGLRACVHEDTDTFRQIVPELEPGEVEKAIPIEIHPGDICIFHADMIHKSLPNLGSSPRLSGVMRAVDMSKQPQPRPLYKAFSYQT